MTNRSSADADDAGQGDSPAADVRYGSPLGPPLRRARSRALRSTWRAQILVEADDIQTQVDWLWSAGGASIEREPLRIGILEHIEAARDIALSRPSVQQLLSGSNILAARQYLDAAIIKVLWLSPPESLRSMLPNLAAEAATNLDSNDERLLVLSKAAEYQRDEELDLAVRLELLKRERSSIIAVVQGSQGAAHREQARLRSFRNVITGVTVTIAVLVIAVGILGLLNPTRLPLCFEGTFGIACPLYSTSSEIASVDEVVVPADTLVVEFIGVLGASLAAATALKDIRGSADPYSLPVALALLKLPTGALTAFLGLLLLRANQGGAITASITSSAQIIAFALVFGYSQQIFTGLVDRQAQTVLAETKRPSNI